MENKLGIAVSSCGNKALDEQGFLSMKEQGIDAIEISLRNYDDFDYKKVKENADKYGVKLWSLHLPFMPFSEIDPSALDWKEKFGTIRKFREIIQKGSEIGIDKFIIHPSGEPIEDKYREEKMLSSMSSLYRLADTASEEGSVICVENLPRTCLGRDSKEIKKLVAVNSKLRVCFDTNHLLKEDIGEFIKNVGSKIVTVHVSDYDFKDEKHWLPGEGDIDWQKLYNDLLAVGYNGMWLYELGFKPETTIDRRDLDYKDFYNNAMEIFGGKNPTAIGKRKI
ncbi:MAG: sugar phosphate isomerase/epimerase [Ruminococcaceae bacterium]|nr:sugar phosphate isomerase/epimerase [Oscillospiraceae bacterium]